MKRKKRTRKTYKPFTKGQLNRFVDDVFHPHFQEDKNLVWIDSALHFLIERSPQLSVEKFIKYNVPFLLKRKDGKVRRGPKRAVRS